MGLFSRLFNKTPKVVSGKNPGKGWTEANRFNRVRGGAAGGYGAWTFSNIMNAHCTVQDIVEEFELNKMENGYGCDAYLIAYQEQYDEAVKEYDDLMGYYTELIEINESEIRDNNDRIQELQYEIDEMEEEIDDLEFELEIEDDFEEIEEIMEQIQELKAEIAERQEEINELEERNSYLEEEIDGWYSEMDFISVEDFINYDEIEVKAMEYACEFAQEWYDGSTWIPLEVLEWGYYTISSHNG